MLAGNPLQCSVMAKTILETEIGIALALNGLAMCVADDCGMHILYTHARAIQHNLYTHALRIP